MVLAVFGVLYAGALIVSAERSGALAERYFFALTVPLVVLSLGALGSMRARRPALIAAVTIAVLASLSVVTVVHDIAIRGAEWDVGEQALADGASVRDVDAGFPWMGYQAEGRVREGPPSRRWQDPKPWYAHIFPDAGNCLSTSAVALSRPELRLVRIHEFRWIPGLGRRKIWLYRNREAC